MTPEQEDQVRRALGGLAGAPGEPGDVPRDRPADPSTPAEVTARLDGVLADLVEPRRLAAERTVREARAAESGRELTARREAAARRGRRRGLLLAAASVAVIASAGYAVVLGGSGGTSSSDSSTAGAAGSAAEDSAPSSSSSSSSSRTAGPGRSMLSDDDPDAPRMHVDTLRRDVRRFLASTASAAPGRTSTGPAAGGASEARTRLGCLRPELRAGERLVAVRLDGRRATLVLSRPARTVDGRSVEARVYSCTSPGRPTASVVAPLG